MPSFDSLTQLIVLNGSPLLLNSRFCAPELASNTATRPCPSSPTYSSFVASSTATANGRSRPLMLDTYLPVLSNFSTAVAAAGAAGGAPPPPLARAPAASGRRAAARWCASCRGRRSSSPRRGQRRRPEAAANVHVARLVDGDARRVMRPVEAFHVLGLPAV